jgi:hypothetical protein
MNSHETHDHHQDTMPEQSGIRSMAANATLHCLTGCAIGEISGLIVGTALGLSNGLTVAISIVLSFIFGFSLSTLPLLKSGLSFFAALSIVMAADTLSIATMEITDNAVMVIVPGAMNASLINPLLWATMPLSLIIAFFAAYPVNKHLLTKGKGHALVMKYHTNHNH